MYRIIANSAPRALGVASVLALTVVGVAVLCREEGMVTIIVQTATVVSLVLAIVSLLLASYQLWQVEKTNHNLLDISQSMSTKFVGRFPNHISDIRRLLESAENSVSIVCDLLGYGYYSSPEQYQEYRAAVLRLSRCRCPFGRGGVPGRVHPCPDGGDAPVAHVARRVGVGTVCVERADPGQQSCVRSLRFVAEFGSSASASRSASVPLSFSLRISIPSSTTSSTASSASWACCFRWKGALSAVVGTPMS